MNKSVVITSEEKYIDCEDDGLAAWGELSVEFPSGEIKVHGYSNLTDESMPCPIPNWGTPYDFESFVKGYAQALIDQGFEVIHVNNSEYDV